MGQQLVDIDEGMESWMEGVISVNYDLCDALSRTIWKGGDLNGQRLSDRRERKMTGQIVRAIYRTVGGEMNPVDVD
jgi:hypothetical protein